MVASPAGSRTLLCVDYVDDSDNPRPADPTGRVADDRREDAVAFLSALLPQDPNTRRRVVSALLRGVIAERKVA